LAFFEFRSHIIERTKNRTPNSVAISASAVYPKKYKIPANNSNMMAKRTGFRNFLIYISLAVAIILIVYYVPNYYFLESAVAHNSSAILSLIGLQAPFRLVDGSAFVGNFAVIRDCTGIQVMAVFLGLILPLPRVSWRKKALSLCLLGVLLYVANLFRVVLEYYLVEAGILPWSLAHYPLSLVLGILGVFLLVLVNNKLIPEFGEYLFSEISQFKALLGQRRMKG
jgi:exosortase/archaeosortase family protein